MRRYPLRQCLAKPRRDEERDDSAPFGLPAKLANFAKEEGVRNAKRQRANAVKTTSSFVNVIFKDQVQTFRNAEDQTVMDLLDDVCRHFNVGLGERRQYELRDGQGAVCPSKGLVESLLDRRMAEDGVTTLETTLHLIEKQLLSELHQAWQFDSQKDLRMWRVDPAYSMKYRGMITLEQDGVIRIASTLTMPVTEANPVGVSFGLPNLVY